MPSPPPLAAQDAANLVEAHPATDEDKTGGESVIAARVAQKEPTAKAEEARMPRSRANPASRVTPKTAAMAVGAETMRHARPRNQPPASLRSRGSPVSRERQKSRANHVKGERDVSPVADATVVTVVMDKVRANAVSLASRGSHGPHPLH